MGRESKKVKDRTCRSCGKMMLVDAAGLKKHWEVCLIAKRSGLILPGVIERPGMPNLVPGR